MEGLGPIYGLDNLGDQVRVDSIGIWPAAVAIAVAGALAPAAADPMVPLDRVSLDAGAAATEASSDPGAAAGLESTSDSFWTDLRVSSLALNKTLHLQVRQLSFDPSRNLPQAIQFLGLMPADSLPLSLKASPTEVTATTLDWDVTNWASLGLTASTSAATLGLIGDVDVLPLSVASLSRSTASTGVAARVKLGDGWITSFSYDLGVAQLSLKDAGALAGGDTVVQSRSYSVAIAKHGLFGDQDALGLSLSQRTDDYFGNVNLPGLDDRIDLLSGYRRVALAGDRHETDLALGYVTTFLNGALALQANAGYQMNVAGQNGINSLTVLSRAKINF